MKAIAATAAALLVGILACNQVSGLLQGNTTLENTALPFTEAAREQAVIPPTDQQGKRKEPTARQRLTPEDCTPENLTRFSRSPFTAETVRVIDGDTVLVKAEGRSARIRLWGIDAPETDQRTGPAATQLIRSYLPQQELVRIHPVETDKYGRIVAVVDHGDQYPANFMMVKEGLAYHRDAFSAKGNQCLMEAQQAARQYRLGIWSDDPQGETRPWEHRARTRPPET